MRDHEATANLAVVAPHDSGFSSADTALLVMPMCHANSLFFLSIFAYAGATSVVLDRRSVCRADVIRALRHSAVGSM